jgi:phosphatidylinositol-3-phosphatase
VSASADPRNRRAAYVGIAGTTLVVLAIVLTLVHRPESRTPAGPDSATPAAARVTTPQVRHVFVINIENKGFRTTWGRQSAAPYLARTLRGKGLLLTQYYATAHRSLGNYTAQISGQGPTLAIQNDCPYYRAFTQSGPTVPPGQVYGTGCVYPNKVGTLPGQLVKAGLSWRGYMEDMATPCQHSQLGQAEQWAKATPQEQYATRHNPFMYFASITGRPAYCRSHVRPLSALRHDLLTKSHTRTLSYITPDLCHDAHDSSCADGGPGGLGAANSWFKTWVPRILRSPAFRANGMLVITSDESEGFSVDARACCGEGPGPNAAQPGIDGPGGGRVGALIISRYVQPGTTSSRAYNHYSLLGSIEDLLGLHRLGYARTVTHVFGRDVYRTP